MVVSRFFDNTRLFARAVAHEAGLPLVLLEGDVGFEYGVRVLRLSRRVWFEGMGPFLEALVRAPRSWQLPRACLRVAEEDVPRLPLPDLWRVVSDLVVPTPAAAVTLLAVMTAQARADPSGPAPGRVNIAGTDLRRQILGQAVPGEDITRLVSLLLKPPGDLPRKVWRSVAAVADACQGRVLVCGDAPQELREHLALARGLEPAGDDPADMRPVDTVVFWQCDSADDGGEALRRGLARLRPGGAVVTLTSAGGAAATSTAADVYRMLRSAEAPPAPQADATAPGVEAPQNDQKISVRAQPAGPLVSAVIPVYNDVRVTRAIASLQDQTYANLEILVVDDGSTDGTARAVAKHLNDPRVRYLHKPHSGRPETRNLGVRQSKGTFIAWLGSDDESLPCRIQRQVEVAEKDGGADIVHTDGLIIRPDGVLHERRRYQSFTPEEFPRRLLAGLAGVCPILDTSAMIRRDVYSRVGLYDPAFLRCQDYDFYVRTAMAGNVRYAHVPLALVKVHQSPPSPEKRGMMVGYYAILARKIMEFFGPDRLADALARDLHIPPHLVLAECLAGIITIGKVPPGHPLCEQAERLLVRAVQDSGLLDRSDACKIMAALARSWGDDALAERSSARAKALAEAALGRPAAPPAGGRDVFGVPATAAPSEAVDENALTVGEALGLTSKGDVP
jgi:glycosyltransferase involved in cell wall biosynthesis